MLLEGAKGRGIGDTKGVPAGEPLEVQFTYLSPAIILTEKVQSSFLCKAIVLRIQQVQFACQLMSVVCIGCIKLSVVMFYRRLFVTQKKSWFSVVTILISAIIVAWTISFFFVFLFYCRSHIADEWSTVSNVIRYCPDALNDDIAIGITDAVVDITVLVVPIPMVKILL